MSTPHVNNSELAFLQANGATSNHLNTAWKQFLGLSLTATRTQVTAMRRQWMLETLGLDDTTINSYNYNDLLKKVIVNGGYNSGNVNAGWLEYTENPPAGDFDSYAASLSPTAWYKLDETSGTTMNDSSGNANHGTYYNTPTLNEASLITGKSDGSVLFTASSQERGQAGVGTIDITGVWSMFTVVKAATLTGHMQPINFDEIARSDGLRGIQVRTDGSVRFIGFQGTTYKFFSTAAGLITVGGTHTIAATHDGADNVTLYVDGAAKLTGSVAGWNTWNDLAYGMIATGQAASTGLFNEWWNGHIDDSLFWTSTELSATQVANLDSYV